MSIAKKLFELLMDDWNKKPKCIVPGCSQVAWRNGYCADCVKHATLRRMLLAQRETNLLLTKLIQDLAGKSNVSFSIPMPINANKTDHAVAFSEEEIKIEEEVFIPSTILNTQTPIVNAIKNKRTLDVGTKLDDANKIVKGNE